MTAAPMLLDTGLARELKACLKRAATGLAEIEAETARAQGLRERSEQAAARRRELDAEADERLGDALEAGKPLPEVSLADKRQRERCKQEERGSAVAAEKVMGHVHGELAERLRQAEAAIVPAALALSMGARDSALATLHPAMNALITPLGELIAARRLGDRYARPPFDLPGGIEPATLWNSEIAVHRFVSAIPPRFLPADFAARVEAAAAELVRAAVAELEGEA